MTPFRPLNELSLEDVADFGGKAARLGEALRLGCPVPRGLVLSTELYRRFMHQGGLQGEIASILAGMQPTAMAHFQAAEWAIRGAFRVRRVPRQVTEAILEAYHSLGIPSVAVRSSATSEDSPQQSFVGQHFAALNVADEKAVIEAVVNCWMSLFSAKALSYAHHFGVDLLNSSMSVILQEIIVPASRGALFTVDPISGDPDVFLIEVQEGPRLGLYRLDPYERRAGESYVWSQLRHIGLLLDEHLCQYQTIEWALTQSQLYLLRVRPVTGVPACLPVTLEHVSLREGPLELVHPPAVTPRALPPYSWYDQSRGQQQRSAYFRRTDRLFARYSGRDDYYFRGYLYTRWRNGAVATRSEGLRELPLLLYALKRWYAARTLDREFRALCEEHHSKLEALNQLDLSTLSKEELSSHLWQIIDLDEAFLVQYGRLGQSPEVLAEIVTSFCRAWDIESCEQSTSLYTVDDQLSQRDRELCELAHADYVSDDAREEAFQAFFRRYRHLYLHGDPLDENQDISRVRDDPDAARERMERLMAEGPRSVHEHQEQVLAERDAWERRAVRGLGAVRGRLLSYALRVARRYVPLRVDAKERLLRCLVLERDLVREVGRRLAVAGLVSQPEDAFLLGCHQVLEWLSGALSGDRLVREVIERKELMRRWTRYTPPEILDADAGGGRRDVWQPSGEQATLRGRPICPGLVEGRARVINSLGEATNVLAGEVLVCKQVLFELSPLFGLVSAVIAEFGGLLDHSATLVREYDVPAIFGVAGLTEAIQTGDDLRVDATRGLVIRKDRGPT